ncbi:MAG: hypothetical protein ACLP9L_22155 [Thermoguttaceae bacterium]
MSALTKRINRDLAKKHHVLRKTRPQGWSRLNLGEFYTLDRYGNVANQHVDLELLGRDLNVMQERETLAG